MNTVAILAVTNLVTWMLVSVVVSLADLEQQLGKRHMHPLVSYCSQSVV